MLQLLQVGDEFRKFKRIFRKFSETRINNAQLKLDVTISKVNQLIHQIIFGVHTNSKQIKIRGDESNYSVKFHHPLI